MLILKFPASLWREHLPYDLVPGNGHDLAVDAGSGITAC